MKKINLLLLTLFFIFSTCKNLNSFNHKRIEPIINNINGNWQPVGNWQISNPNCQRNCTSLWYILYRYTEKDVYGRYQYCYVFQSNSKWNNGTLANTAMYDLKIYLDSKVISSTSYIIAGTGTQYSPQAKIYFYVNPSDIKSNSIITFYAKNTYIN